MHLTTDNKKHPHLSWAQIRHLFLAIHSDVSFYLWTQLCTENDPFLIKEPGQAMVSLFCCVALAWARIPTRCSYRGQSPGQKPGLALPALPAAAAQESPHIQLQSLSELSCHPELHPM